MLKNELFLTLITTIKLILACDNRLDLLISGKRQKKKKDISKRNLKLTKANIDNDQQKNWPKKLGSRKIKKVK